MTSKDRSQQTGVRAASKRQARTNAEQAKESRRWNKPGVDDDSELVQSAVGALAAPVEGALDSLREGERSAARTDRPDERETGSASPKRQDNVPLQERAPGAKIPTKPEDAEAEPSEIAEDMSRDRPGTERSRR